MKYILPVFTIIFLFCQCTDLTTTKETDGTSDAKTSLQISSTTRADYESLKKRERIQSPIGRLCAESKGYRKDEWDALNECSWAVEKHQMNLYPKVVSRSGGQLKLFLADSTTTLTHRADEYYQFVEYLPSSNHTVIRVLRPSSCPEYWLINMKSGVRTVITGHPIFTADKEQFLLSSSSSNGKINCPAVIEHWALKKGVFSKRGKMNHETAIQDLMWENNTSWLGIAGDKIVRIAF